MTAIDDMIKALVRCTKCGAQGVGTCDCWDPPDDELIVFTEFGAEAHDGPGWYYYHSEYTDEGCVGAFKSEDEAKAHARADGWIK